MVFFNSSEGCHRIRWASGSTCDLREIEEHEFISELCDVDRDVILKIMFENHVGHGFFSLVSSPTPGTSMVPIFADDASTEDLRRSLQSFIKSCSPSGANKQLSVQFKPRHNLHHQLAADRVYVSAPIQRAATGADIDPQLPQKVSLSSFRSFGGNNRRSTTRAAHSQVGFKQFNILY